MRDTYKFNIGQSSLVLGREAGFGYQNQQAMEPWPKPVFAIPTQGWLVIDLHGDVIKALGRSTLQKTKAGLALLPAHFETEQAIYQLHVNTRVQLNLRD